MTNRLASKLPTRRADLREALIVNLARLQPEREPLGELDAGHTAAITDAPFAFDDGGPRQRGDLRL